MEVKPFLKWVGGKRKLIPQLEAKFPDYIKSNEFTYVEPFLGGGAMFFHLITKYNIKKAYLNDLLDNHIEEINNFAIEKNIENEKFVQLFSKINVNNELSKYILLNIIIENNNSFPREILSDDLSLEHILPKTPDFNTDWRDDNFITEEDENGDLVTRALNKSIHERFLDRLGNHTILTRADNSYNSNRPYADKLPIYNEESMPSITNSNSNHSVTFYENWNAESIESRQVALSLLAKDIWSL